MLLFNFFHAESRSSVTVVLVEQNKDYFQGSELNIEQSSEGDCEVCFIFPVNMSLVSSDQLQE